MANRHYHAAASPSVPASTPSWMAKERKQRQRSRGYGRRTSSGGTAGFGKTPMNNRRRDSTTALFGSTAATATAPNNNRFEPSASLDFDDEDDINADNELDRAVHSRTPRINRSFSLSDHLEREAAGEDDHRNDFPAMTKRKKNGPNLPRPPKPARSNTLASSLPYSGLRQDNRGHSRQQYRDNIDTSSFEFESESNSNIEEDAMNEEELHSSPVRIGARGDIKRSKIMLRRSVSVPIRSSSTPTLSSYGVRSTTLPSNTLAAPTTTSLFEENVHPNDTISNNDTVASTPVVTRRSSRLEKKQKETASVAQSTRSRTNSKKRSASPSSRLGPSEMEPSPPKIPSMSNFSTFSSSSKSSSRTSSDSTESFSSLAKQQQHSGQGWGNSHRQRHNRSVSAFAASTVNSPAMQHHKKSLSMGMQMMSELKTSHSSPSLEGPSTPSVGSVSSHSKRCNVESNASTPLEAADLDGSVSSTSSQIVDRFQHNASEPINMLSPPPFHKSQKNDVCFLGSEEKDFGRNNDNEFMMNITHDDDDDDEEEEESISSDMSEESEYEDALDEEQKEMTDAEIFQSKSSYEDFKFLVKFLRDWHKRVNAKNASMGLNDGCLVAIPPDWLFERRANFSKWAVTALGFRVGSVGGGGGSFLKCSEIQGKEVYEKLRRILNEHKAGKLQLTLETDTTTITAALSTRKQESTKSSGTLFFSPCDNNEESNSKKRPPFRLPMQPRMSLSPPTDAFVGDILADAMKDMSMDSRQRKSGQHVPQLIRSTLQPLNRIKNALPPRPRLSSGDDMGSTRDFMESLHGVIGSPSPMGVARSLRNKCSRVLHPPEQLRGSIGRPPRQSFDRNKPCESPHPRNTIAQQTPGQLCLETPITKPVDMWGSKPIAGRDWGDSVQCCYTMVKSCNQIFAESWFTSEFHKNEGLCSEYHVSMTEEEEHSLCEYYNARDETSMNCEEDDAIKQRKMIGFHRNGSIGASAFAHLHLDDDDVISTYQDQNDDKKRAKKLRKMRRMTLFAAASGFLQPSRRFRLSTSPTKHVLPLQCVDEEVPFERIMDCEAFSSILSFLSEGELLHTASLVSSAWADASAEALGTLMLVSVGCNPSLINDSNDDEMSDTEDVDDMKEAADVAVAKAKPMQKEWVDVLKTFPWANFLSDGAFKRVYKVWNESFGSYEAISVMDVDAIEASGNLNCVGAELAVSQLLSSVARRNICPNFVITRGVFTCLHEPPALEWGHKENVAPQGTVYNGQGSNSSLIPEPGPSANYQYIRMELCQHGDMEEFIRNVPSSTLSPIVCRNLLFQMAFSLHVASDRFGLKHYDVKLLNFFLQSALDPSIAVDNHPNVVLRYGVGSHVFRLRMDPNNAHIAKLADYGTSVLRSSADGQPVSLGQFTTLENTPPDYLILGNAAEQGIGHDCFGLGLCMLHLFTGHGPYEEILEEVVCPANFKGRLSKIWKSSSHDVIRSVMLYDDEDGQEVEDDTLYNTLYRFLVLFGVPQRRFSSRKHGKVWRAIDATLLPPKANGCPDMAVFRRDVERFSLSVGNDERIANARNRLEEMDGAMELLLSLVSFDPKKRSTPLDVINSRFMAALIEDDATTNYCGHDIVKSYTAYQT